MKVKIPALLLSAALLLSLAACGSSTDTAQSTDEAQAEVEETAAETEETTEETAAEAEEPAEEAEEAEEEAAPAEGEPVETVIDQETIDTITAANDWDSLAAEYGSICMTYEDIQSSLTTVYYDSADFYMETSTEGYVLIDSADYPDAYGRFTEADEDYFKICMINDDDYALFEECYKSIPWYTSDLIEADAAVKEEDGLMIVTTQKPIETEDQDYYAQLCDIDADSILGYEVRLELDPETKIISRIVISLDCGSTGILLVDANVEYGAEQPALPDGMEDFIRDENVCHITMVENNGTDQEIDYEDAIRTGCSYNLIAEDYDVWTDEACTEAADTFFIPEENVTLYLTARE